MTHVPKVKRLHQYDWQGRQIPDAKICAIVGKERQKQCAHVAKFEVDGIPMCMVHAKARVLDDVVTMQERQLSSSDTGVSK